VAAVDIAVLVPAVKRALGAVGLGTLSDDAVYGLTADALADVMLYTGSVFGTTLEVLTRDANGVPETYGTGRELTLPETAMIRAQAALNRLFVVLRDEKISERIADESQAWEWAKSAQLLRDQLKLLVDERDKALNALMAQGAALDAYESFVATQDSYVSQRIEPYLARWGSGDVGFPGFIPSPRGV
jgi:hypothetical protein